MVLGLSIPERLISAFGAICGIALLGYLLITGMAVTPGSHADRPFTLLALRPPVPERPLHPLVPPKLKRSPAKARPPRGGGAPPPPLLVVPAPILPPTPVPQGRQGPVASAGTLAGLGVGASNDGEGDGSGNGGGSDVPPRQIKGRLKYSDLPPELRGQDTAIIVSVRYTVDVDGKVRACSVTASSGSSVLDERICDLIEERFRFEPSRDPDGRPVRSIIVENHRWETERSSDPSSRP